MALSKQYTMPTLSEIERYISEAFSAKDNDNNVLPDVIIHATEDTFAATINIGSKLTTGKGGFREFLKHVGSLDFLKVTFNRRVLNQEEKQLLYNRIMNGV